MRASYRKGPVLAIEDLGLQLGDLRGDPIESLARFGARLVLMSYVEAEVSAFLGAGRYERSDSRQGSRNGHRPRKVACGVGAIEIDYPKVRGAPSPFRSGILQAWQRTSESLTATLPSLYIEGLSTRDFERALSPLWEGAHLSRSTVSRANEAIKEGFQEWRRRSLAKERVVYLFLDGHYEGVRLGVKQKEAVLVAHGITQEGSRTVLSVSLGCTESADSWKLVLQDLVARGLGQPLLVISDGNPGLIRALRETWPTCARQRCTVHRTRNVLARAPKKDHKAIRECLNRIFYAGSLEEALEAARQFAARWRERYPSAVEVVGKDLADCLTFYRFPQAHWRRLRTSNSLERCFREVRRRTRVVGRFPTEISALSLIWSVFQEHSGRWHGMAMDSAHLEMTQTGAHSLTTDPIEVEGFEELIAA
jgi:transposase-like protein